MGVSVGNVKICLRDVAGVVVGPTITLTMTPTITPVMEGSPI